MWSQVVSALCSRCRSWSRYIEKVVAGKENGLRITRETFYGACLNVDKSLVRFTGLPEAGYMKSDIILNGRQRRREPRVTKFGISC